MFPLPPAWTHETGLPLEAGILELWDTPVPIISGTTQTWFSLPHHGPGEPVSVLGSAKNIGFDGYIGTWILWIYWIYIGGYFYMNIDISEINKNTLKFMEILCKSVKMTLIMKYRH